VTIAGVEVRDSDLAKRVCLLHAHGEEALGLHLGHAIDHLHDYFVLTPRDREAIRRVLAHDPPELADLRACLLADELGRVSGGRS
jgi:urease accessory protein UreE